MSTLRGLADRWIDGWDWRAREREMNALPHFTVDLDGAPVHFVHLRGEGPDPFPIVLTHGWPGSFLELLGLADRLAHPSHHDGDAARPFDVVVPSLPGFGFSAQRPQRTDPSTTPQLWHRLMTDVLGYARYGAHGGDLGAGVTTRLGALYPDAVAGIHLLAVGAPDLGAEGAAAFSDDERTYVEQAGRWERDEGAYQHQQQTRPVTLAYGLSDSPVGLLAWLVETYRAWSDSHGDLASRFSDYDVPTWTSLYWLTNAIAPSFRPYNDHYANMSKTPRVTVPTALALFPADLSQPPREWAERHYAITRYTRMPRGATSPRSRSRSCWPPTRPRSSTDSARRRAPIHAGRARGGRRISFSAPLGVGDALHDLGVLARGAEQVPRLARRRQPEQPRAGAQHGTRSTIWRLSPSLSSATWRRCRPATCPRSPRPRRSRRS